MSQKLVARAILLGLAAGGVILIISAVRSGSGLWWKLPVGAVPVLLALPLTFHLLRAAFWSRERRNRVDAALEERKRALDDKAGSPFFAHRAAKGKKGLLGNSSAIPATAVIHAIRDSGRANEFEALVYLELDVKRDDDVRRVKTGEYVARAYAGLLQPGRTLTVVVDPDDADHIAVDWPASASRD